MLYSHDVRLKSQRKLKSSKTNQKKTKKNKPKIPQEQPIQTTQQMLIITKQSRGREMKKILKEMRRNRLLPTP